MLKKLNLIGVIIGIVIMACSYFAFSFDVEINKPHLGEIGLESISAPQMESDKAYGGDAYTGMQQAAAQAANNLIPVFEAIEANNYAISELNNNNIEAADAAADNAEAIVSTIKHCVGVILLAVGLTVIAKSVELDIVSKKNVVQYQETETSL